MTTCGRTGDATGVVVPTASNAVTFTVSGAGTIAGVDNGNPISQESFRGNSMHAFSGKCMLVVRSSANAGVIQVQAGSSGLTSASASILSGIQTGIGNRKQTIDPVSATGIRWRRNWPNPFRTMTRIDYSLQKKDRVILRIFSPQGTVVRTLVDGDREAGEYSAVWNGADMHGRPLPSGVYLMDLRCATGRISQRLDLIR